MNKLELLTAWYKDPDVKEYKHVYTLNRIRDRQENGYDRRFNDRYYGLNRYEEMQKYKDEDLKMLEIFKSAFSWKERYRYNVKFEVVCDDYYFRDGDWSNDLQSIKDVVSGREEPSEDFYDFDWDWNGDEGENINAFRLGDEMNRFIEVDVYELTPKFEIVEDSDSIKLVEIGEKTNVE